MRAHHLLLRALITFCVAGCALPAWPAAAEPIDVSVHLEGERVVVDVSTHVSVTRDVAWSVLTDYEHMAHYVSNLKSSTVLSRDGNRLQIEQSGEVRQAWMSFGFTTVRAVDLVPEREILSHLVRGDFKYYESTTTLAGKTTGPITITHHGEYESLRWVPPLVGPSLIESETRKQYTELLSEMHKRQAAAPISEK